MQPFSYCGCRLYNTSDGNVSSETIVSPLTTQFDRGRVPEKLSDIIKRGEYSLRSVANL